MRWPATAASSDGDTRSGASSCSGSRTKARSRMRGCGTVSAGRERPYRNAPRTLDLDLLLFGDGCIQSAALTIPHPRMRERAFVLLPLQELEPQRVAAADLAAVAGQRIVPLPPTSSPA